MLRTNCSIHLAMESVRLSVFSSRLRVWRFGRSSILGKHKARLIVVFWFIVALPLKPLSTYRARGFSAIAQKPVKLGQSIALRPLCSKYLLLQ